MVIERMINERLVERLKFLLDRALDGKKFYLGGQEFYFPVGGAICYETDEVVRIDVINGKEVNVYKRDMSDIALNELLHPDYELTLEPSHLSLKNFVATERNKN